jgi:hypothetical protein
MVCHLGWHFPVGCSLRDGRGEFINKRDFFSTKTIKEINMFQDMETRHMVLASGHENRKHCTCIKTWEQITWHRFQDMDTGHMAHISGYGN